MGISTAALIDDKAELATLRGKQKKAGLTKGCLSLMANSYDDPNVLADVMALIQVLARTADDTVRSETGLTDSLQGKPKSSDTWISLAQNHREFFRVNTDPQKASRVSLISRYVLAKDERDKRPPLSAEETAKLLELAISLHDRETTRRDRWKPWLISLLAALMLGLFGLITALVKSCPQS